MQIKPNTQVQHGILFGIIAAIIWGLFPVVTLQSMQQSLSPYDIAALRFLVVGPLLIPVLWKLRLTNLSYFGAALLVIGAGAPYLILVTVGLQFAPAAHFGAITPSSMLIFSAIGSWFWLGETFTKKRIIGTAIIVIGIFVISWEGLTSNIQQVWLGDLMFCLGGLLWAIYTITLRVYKIPPMHAVAIVSVVSAVLYLPPYFILGEPGIAAAPFSDVLFQAVFQGVFAVLVALFLYSKAVAILGAAKGAIFGALVPTVALLMAIPILNEMPTTFQITGIFLVTSGMFLALGLFRKKRQ